MSLHRIKLSRILVAMDFSASSKSVLRSGIMLEKRLKAKVRLVHAYEPSGFLSSKRVLNRRIQEQFQEALTTSEAAELAVDNICIPGTPWRSFSNRQ